MLPFLDLQYLYGLARAGRPEADTLMRNIEAHAPARTGMPGPRGSVCLPASRGLLAHARGDCRRRGDELGHALPRLVEIGGSHAQRDLFSQVHRGCTRSKRPAAGAQNLLGNSCVPSRNRRA